VDTARALLVDAVARRASDVHLEPRPEALRVRMRVDGALREVDSLPRELAPAVASRLKVLAQLDIVERQRGQDGQLMFEHAGQAFDVRVATLGTVFGEKVVLRILDRQRPLRGLQDLGCSSAIHAALRRLLLRPVGMIVVAGPTGSGKTTTLHAALREIDDCARNVATIEDPVEYLHPAANQTQINRLAGITFAGGLRALLRQDPDVILLGETRDEETARIAMQAALSGHLVLTSVHAPDAVSALLRFLNMGIEPYLVAAGVMAVLAQRLARRICDGCGEWRGATATERGICRVWGCDVPPRLRAGGGCERCEDSGFRDRTGIVQLLELDDDVRQALTGSPSRAGLAGAARGTGMASLQRAAYDSAAGGATTLGEVARVLGEAVE
jgi:type IV pilus assembly protein PilB